MIILRSKLFANPPQQSNNPNLPKSLVVAPKNTVKPKKASPKKPPQQKPKNQTALQIAQSKEKNEQARTQRAAMKAQIAKQQMAQRKIEANQRATQNVKNNAIRVKRLELDSMKQSNANNLQYFKAKPKAVNAPIVPMN